jgi:hypothetical protein
MLLQSRIPYIQFAAFLFMYQLLLFSIVTNTNMVWAKGIFVSSTLGDVYGTDQDTFGAMVISYDNKSMAFCGSYQNVLTLGSNQLQSLSSVNIFIAKRELNGTFLWSASSTGADSNICKGIAMDREDNVYAVGTYSGTNFAFNGTYLLPLVGLQYNAFLVKFDTNGDFQWAIHVSGEMANDLQVARDVTVDQDDNVVFIGNFQGHIVFNETSNATAVGNQDIFLAKVNPLNGDYFWAITAGGPSTDSVHSVLVDQNNDIYIVGYIQGWAYFGSVNVTTIGTQDAFIAKYSDAGDLIWVKHYGGQSSSASFNSIVVNSMGYKFLGGSFTNQLQIGNYSFSSSNQQGLVATLDSSDNPLWVSTIVASNTNDVSSVTFNNNSDVFVSGFFQGTISLGSSSISTSSTSYDIYIAKFSNDGLPMWALQAGPDASSLVNQVAMITDDLLFVGGSLLSSAFFDTTPASSGVFIVEALDLPPNCTMLHNCSGNGVCINDDLCQCDPGYFGNDCSINCTGFAVVIRGDSLQELHVNQPLTLIGEAQLCVPAISGATLTYKWERVVTSSDINLGFFTSPVYGNPLQFLSYQFPPEATTYTFKVTVFLQSTIANLTASQVVDVEIIEEEPVAIIAGGNRQIPLNSNLYLSAVGSYYANAPSSAANYTWTCSVVPSAQYPSLSSCPYDPLPSNQNITVQFNTAGNYLFTLTYSIAGKEATASVVISTAPLYMPSPFITSDYYPYVPTGRELQFEATINVTANTYPLSNFYWQWDLLANISGALTSQPLTPSDIGVPTLNTRELVILPNVLLPNMVYYLRFTVFDRQDPTIISFSEIALQTSPSPEGGWIEVFPSSGGTGLETLFTLTASNWTTIGQLLPLRYSFQFKDSSGQWQVLSPYSTCNVINTVLPVSNTDSLSVRVLVSNYGGEVAISETTVSVQSPNYPSLSSLISQIEQKISNLQQAMDNGYLFSGEVGANAAVLLETIRTELSQFPNSSSILLQLEKQLISIVVQEQIIRRNSQLPISYNYLAEELQVLSSLTSSNMDQEAVEMVLQSLLLLFNKNEPVYEYLSPGVRLTILNNQLFGEAANILSEIIRDVAISDNETMSVQFINATVNLAQVSIAGMVPGQFASSMFSENFTVVAELEYASNTSNLVIGESSFSSVILPSNFQSTQVWEIVNSNPSVGFIFVALQYNIYGWSNTEAPSTSIVLFKVVDQNWNQYNISNLSQPLTILLPIQTGALNGTLISLLNTTTMINNTVDNSTTRLVCKYWNENDPLQTAWEQYGCEYAGITQNNQVICECSHTTSFASFVEYPPLAKGQHISNLEEGLFATEVVINSLLLIIALPLLIALGFIRKAQPLRSRFIGPYVGLLAICIECILQGIVRNSLLISNADPTRVAVNIIHYIIMVTVNPLSLLAWFLFFWQQVRYLLLKHIYLAMSKNEISTIRFSRLLTSKIVYVTCCLIVTLITFAFYLLFLILRVSNAISYDPTLTIEVVTYSIASMLFGLLIVVIFFCDLIFEYITIRKKEKWQIANEQNSEKTKEEKYDFIVKYIKGYFLRNDPLRFRIEAIFMLLTVLSSFISYIIGIYQQVDDNSTKSITVAGFVFNIFYLLFRIIAFGGFVGVISLINYIQAWDNVDRKVAEKAPDMAETIKMFIRDSISYPLFHDYCANEFSLENLLLWKELDRLRPMISSLQPSQLRSDILSLKATYLAVGSKFEVNIPNELRQRFLKTCSMEQSPKAKDIEILISDLVNAVMDNVADTWIRFVKTEAYRNFIHAKEIRKKLDSGDTFTK